MKFRNKFLKGSISLACLTLMLTGCSTKEEFKIEPYENKILVNGNEYDFEYVEKGEFIVDVKMDKAKHDTIKVIIPRGGRFNDWIVDNFGTYFKQSKQIIHTIEYPIEEIKYGSDNTLLEYVFEYNEEIESGDIVFHQIYIGKDKIEDIFKLRLKVLYE